MNPKLLIVTDLGLLKAYKLAFTPGGSLHLDRVKTEVLKEAHHRLVEKVTDLAGRRASPFAKISELIPSHRPHFLFSVRSTCPERFRGAG